MVYPTLESTHSKCCDELDTRLPMAGFSPGGGKGNRPMAENVPDDVQ